MTSQSYSAAKVKTLASDLLPKLTQAMSENLGNAINSQRGNESHRAAQPDLQTQQTMMRLQGEFQTLFSQVNTNSTFLNKINDKIEDSDALDNNKLHLILSENIRNLTRELAADLMQSKKDMDQACKRMSEIEEANEAKEKLAIQYKAD